MIVQLQNVIEGVRDEWPAHSGYVVSGDQLLG